MMTRKVSRLLLWIGAGLLILSSLVPLWLLSSHSALISHTTTGIVNQTATPTIHSSATQFTTSTKRTTSTTPIPVVTASETAITEPSATTVPVNQQTPIANSTNSPISTATDVASPTSIPSPTPISNAKLYIDQPPTYGYGFTLSGSGFTPGEAVTIYWDYQQPGQLILGTSTADSTGWFRFGIPTAPSGPGTFQIASIGATSKVFAISTVQEMPYLFLSTKTAAPGTLLQIKSGGFASEESVKITFTNSTGTTTVATVASDVQGAFATSFVVPPFNNDAGNAIIRATGVSSGIFGTALFQYPLVVTVSPNSASMGTAITIVGNHFTAYKVADIYFDGVYLQRIALDGNGFFSWTTKVPGGLVIGQTYAISVTDGMSNISVSIPFLVQ